MELQSVNADDVLTGGIRMGFHVRNEVTQLNVRIFDDTTCTRTFYNNFHKSTDFLYGYFIHLKDINPGERESIVSKLPPIPDFLYGKNTMSIQVDKYQRKKILFLAGSIGTDPEHIMTVSYFYSTHSILIKEFPYLLDHYRFLEAHLNHYIEKTYGKVKLNVWQQIRDGTFTLEDE